jgi:hypothetical protein
MTILEQFCQRIVIITLLLGVSGCVVIPVPLPIDDAVEARRDSVGRSVTRFQTGVTTRRDILLALGEPDATSIDERKLVYWAPKWRVWCLLLGYYICDWDTLGDIDYIVAEFDGLGLLVKFEEAENCPPLMVPLTCYSGHKVLLQQGATKIDVIKWHLDKFQNGTIILTETELIFISHKPMANAPDLQIAYSSISDVYIKGLAVDALCVRCRSGAEYKFWIDHLNPDEQQEGKALQKAYSLIRSRLTS